MKRGDLTTTVTGSKGPVEGDLLTDGRKLKALTRSEVSAQPVTPLRGDSFEKRTSRSTTDHQLAVGQEAASAQAVNRGRKVIMSEVSDQETSPASLWRVKNKLTTPFYLDLDATVTSPTVVEPSRVDAMAREVRSSRALILVARHITSGSNHSGQNGLCAA